MLANPSEVERIGPEWEAKLWERCTKTYGTNLIYIVDKYGACLCTTERVELAWVRREEQGEPSQWNPSGIRIRVEPTEVWPPDGYVPVADREEFSARFHLHHLSVRPAADMSEPDDGVMFERTVGALRRAA